MRFLIAGAFLICALQEAWGLQKANPQDYRDIQTQIRKKAAAEKELQKQDKALKEAGDKAALVRDIKIEIVRLEKEQKAAAEQAIWLTIRAYDVIGFGDNEPIFKKGHSVLPSPEKGKEISWLPIFDLSGEKPSQNQFGPDGGSRIIGPRVAGNTASDGISRLFPSAFASPVELASYIIHEKRHFIQNTTPGESDKKTTAELEVEAYEEELKLATDPENILGYSGKIKERQKQRLIGLLEGEDGKPGYKEIAKRERADAEALRGGRPLPERSLLSHSEDELKRLVQEAREQIEIAQRDHDERLRNTLLKLTDRSCKDPGSVTQAELDALPRPHRRDFLTQGPVPVGQRKCEQVYIYLGEGFTDAETVKNIAMSSVLMSPPADGPAPLRPIVPKLFSSIFPEIKEFAIAACRDIRQAPYISSSYGNYFVTDSDESTARRLMSGQDNCSQQLFLRIIERTRANEGYFALTEDWVKNVVKANPPAPAAPPTYDIPTPAPPQGRRCEDYGVINCPKNVERGQGSAKE